MTASFPPPDKLSYFSPGTPLVGPALLAAVPAALIAAAPSAVRVSAGGRGGLLAWAVIAGLLVLPLLGAIAAARAARQALAASSSLAVTRCLLAGGLALALALPVHGLMGALLRTHTHHRPLAGVTFAVLALVTDSIAVVAGYRLAAMVTGNGAYARANQQNLRLTALVTCGVTLTMGATSALFVSGEAGQAPALRALVLDVALVVAVVALGATMDPPRSRSQGWLGGSLALILLLGGWALARANPDLMAEVDAQAPLAAPLSACLRSAGITP